MNKKHIILLAAALALVSCNVMREEAVPLAQKVTFQATLCDNPPTKTVLQSNGDVYWTPGDAINVFYKDDISVKLTSDSSATSASAQTSFSGVMEGLVPNGKDYFWAVYPYNLSNTFDGTSVTLTLPNEQQGVAGSFDDDLFISMAKSQDYHLAFYNLCGGIKFSVTSTGIEYVTFTGNSGEILAGQVKASFNTDGRPQVEEVVKGASSLRLDAPDGGFEVGKWYYIVSLPAELTAGYCMTFFKNGEMFSERVSEDPVTIKRAVWGRLTNADEVPEPFSASKYLTFTSEGVTTLSLTNYGENAPVLYFSNDADEWTQWDYSELVFTNDLPLYICGDNPDGLSLSSGKYSSFVSSGSNYSIEGSIMSLLNKEEDIVEIPSNYCFINLFKGCEKLVSGPSLPATSLKNNCYSGMFQGCSSLTVAPDLPATNLTVYCYHLMFSDCTALSFAPILSSTSLGYGCYESMFMGCTGLMEAPELPATFLTGLCYESMFQGCTALTAAPDLPATTLTDHCYAHMFWGCSNLESAPVLPATVMETYCYQTMFYGCTSLTEAPELPGLSLADGCYNMMFAGCTGLSEAPLLPAATLVESCYSQMFYGCSNLSRVECRATDISASSCLYWWLGGTASQGVFVKSPSMNDWPSGISGIPEGWTVEDAISANNYLTFTSQGTSSVYLSSVGGGDQPVLYYSYDSIIWESWDYSMLTFTADTPLYLCGDNPEGFSFDVSAYSTLGILGDKCTVSGDVMSLLDKDEELTEIPTPYCFAFLFGGDSLVSGPDLTATTLTSGCYYGMFQGNKGLTSAPALPAVTLAENCYANMFYGCTGLTAAPELPAATLASSCYANMFNGCTGLTSAPSLSATELAYRCYYGMFQDCASLLAAPSLPATTMAEECYYTMFQGCSKLETAPELSATTLATGCYMGMFSTCTSLTEAPELPATTLAASCYYNMFAGCTKLVTAPELPATTLEYGCYAGMFSGCTSLTKAPVLPAQSLENMCYASLFTGCTSLNYVKCLATENMGGSNTGGWLSNVAATGTFIKAPNAQWESGMSGIPEGWEVVDDDGTSNSGHEGTDQGDEHLWG